MPSMASETKVPAASTSAVAVTAAGGASTAPGVQDGFQTPGGRSVEASRSSNSHGSTNAGIGNQLTHDPPVVAIDGADQENHKEAIISILEDWAEWERTLEVDVHKKDVTRGVQDMSGVATPQKLESSSVFSNDRSAFHHTSPETPVVPAFGDSALRKPHLDRRKMLSATYTGGDSTQSLYASRRERRRAEKHDPVARARRQALKVWAADQTRRRSSAEQSNISESLSQRELGPSMRKLALANAGNRRRSSADVTVDHNRKCVGQPSENESFRRKKPPFHAFAPREISSRRDVRSVDHTRPQQGRSLRTEAAGRGPKLKKAGSKPELKRRTSHPWRENMKELGKRGGWPASYIPPQRGSLTTTSTPPASTAVASPSPSSSGAMVSGRGSPWARSPSRETAGGILVKHCFFYGSTGKAATRSGVAAAAKSPTFESSWMRQFREEVQSNPNWWVGPDQFGRATTSYYGTVFGRGKGVGGAPARSAFPTAVAAPRGKGGKADRATDLWKEVRALLAAGKHGSTKRLGGGKPGSEGGNEEGAVTTDINYFLSFGDRLRCTPLSQGAWLVGNAAMEAAAMPTSVEQKAQGVNSLPGDDGITGAAAETSATLAATADAEGGSVGDSRLVSSGSVSDIRPTTQQVASRDKGKGQTGGNGRSRVTSESSWRGLQSIHATTLAKLRGEIDPVTREELVLRAAEEARGALARDRARSTSPRRSSAGVFRPSSKARKSGYVPDSIDYDKVEATLSLIELATRAAGPDAGKQMLHALEGLDKIHQRVSDESDASKDEGRKVGSKIDPAGSNGAAVCETGEAPAAKASGNDSRRDSSDGSVAKEGNATGGEDTRLISGSSGVGGTTKGLAAEGALPTPTNAEASRRNEDQPDGDPSPAAENSSSTADQDDPLLEAEAAGDASLADPPQALRKLSLALSSSSDESAKSDSSSVGVIQSIGKWLFASPSPERSRRNSRSSISDADGEQDGGRNEFPLPRKGSASHSDAHVETTHSDEEAVSDNETGGLNPSRGRSASEPEGGAVADESSGVTDSEVEISGDVEPPLVEQDSQDDTPSERKGSIVGIKPNGQQSEGFPSERQDTTRGIAVERSGSTDQDPRDSPSTGVARFSNRARRSSEADKPTGLPHLAVEIARIEGSVLSTGGFQREAAGRGRLNDEDKRRPDVVGNPPTSTIHFSAEPIRSEESRSRADCGRLESKYGVVAVATEEPSSGRLEKAVGNGNLDGEFRVGGGEICSASLPTHAAISGVGTGPPHGESSLLNATRGRFESRTPAHTTAERGVYNEELRQTGIAKGGESTPAEAGDGGRPDTLISLHRDSWMSVGTRPRRGKNAAIVETPPRSVKQDERRVAGTPSRPGRPAFETTAAVPDPGSIARDAKKGATAVRWDGRKVSVKFAWPKPGWIGNPKRLRPPGERKKPSASPLSGTPGIVRRSPLIDALHPEVSRQREFQRKLRETRKQRDAAAASAASAASDAALEPSGNRLGQTTGRAGERRRHDAVAAVGSPGVASGPNARQAAPAEVKAKKTTERCGTGGTASTTAATPKVEAKTRSRRRSLWSEPASFPVAPLSVAPLPSPPSSGRPLLAPSDSGGLVDEGPPSSRTVFSDAGSHTVLQWGCVDEWLARARRSLGERVWACLGSSSAFSRTLGRIQQSIMPGYRSRHDAAAVTAAASLAADPGGLRSSSAVRKGFEAPSPGGGAKPAEVVRGRGGNRRGERGEVKKVGSTHVRKSRAWNGSRTSEHSAVEEAIIDEREVSAGGWDGGLSEKTALAIDAVIWTVATERERTTVCETVCRKLQGRGGDGLPVGQFEDGLVGEKAGPAPAVSAAAAVAELRISLPTARRFIKGSRLVDGVYVLDADVDLAFKRWEELEPFAGPGSPDHSPVASSVIGEKGAHGRANKGEGLGCGFAVGAKSPPPKQTICEAVGCSDPARYGDIQPMATARLCRKHRRNGMVDVGSRRCDRPGCGRLAVGGSPNGRIGESAMCTLHAREGRVGVEGLAFVLLELSKARHTRTRRLPASPPSAAIEAEEQAIFTRTGSVEGAPNEPELNALHVSAVQNVLLAVSHQPLVPDLPAAGRQQMRRPRAMDGGSRLDSPVNGEHRNDSFASSIASVKTRPSDRSPAAARMTPRAKQQGDCRRVRNISFHNYDETTGAGSQNSAQSDVLETAGVGRAGRRPSAAGAFAVAASSVPAAPECHVRGEKEQEGRDAAHVCLAGERRESRPSRQHEIERETTGGREGQGLPGGRATYSSEHVEEEGGRQGEERPVSKSPRRSQCTTGGSGTVAHGDAELTGGDDGRQRDAEAPQQSRGCATGGIGRVGSGDLAESLDSSVASGGKRADASRRSGVDEVFGENATSLRAVFDKFSRQSASADKRGAATTMSLSDVLRFCDAFELRPGLVSTRGILDSFKEVAYPGVVGLTDEEIGYRDTAECIPSASSAQAVRPSSRRNRLTSAPLTGAACLNEVSRRPRLSPSESTHAGTDVSPGSVDRAGCEDDRGKGCLGPPAVVEKAELDATLVGDHAALKEVALQDLTLKELATASAEVTGREEEAHEEGGSETTPALHGELSRMASDSTEGTFQRESSSSSFRRGTGGRRGTAQQEDDECSLYFKSDSGAECQHRTATPSRRASSASSSGNRGGVSGRGKRTVYLGRTQVFPLRRVESSLAVDARGFGVSGACPDAATGAGGDPRRQTSTLGSSTIQRKSSSRRPSGTCDPRKRGGVGFVAGDAAFDPAEGAPSTAAEPGLTEAQFFEWLTEVATECKVLTTKKTLGCSVNQPRPRVRSDGRKRKVSEPVFFSPEGGRSENGSSSSVNRRRNAARAIVLLQWIEVSRGMNGGKGGGIPPFRLSSSLAKRSAHTS